MKIIKLLIFLIFFNISNMFASDTTIVYPIDSVEYDFAMEPFDMQLWEEIPYDVPLDTYLWGHHVNIPPDTIEIPVNVVVKSEALNKNEVLQTILELETEQTDVLNQNLNTLNNILQERDKQTVKTVDQVLESYDIDPDTIAHLHKVSHIVLYSILLMLLTGFIIYFNYDDHNRFIYKSKNPYKFWWYYVKVTINTAILFLYIYILYLLAEISIPGLYLWENINKLY